MAGVHSRAPPAETPRRSRSLIDPHRAGANQLDNLDRRRDAIDRMLAAVDAAVPDALGLDPKSVTMTQLVNRVAHPRPGRELRRGDAALASTGESRKALRHSADRDLCRAARDSEAHFDDVIGDGRRRRNVEEAIHRAPAAAIRAILMANSRLIVIQPRSKPVTWPSSFLTGVSTARRGLGNGTTFANERRR